MSIKYLFYKGKALFLMFQLFIILVSIKDMANFYSFVLFVYRANNTIFPLVHAVPLKASINKILQLFIVLRLWVSPERENFNEDLSQDLCVRHTKVLELRESIL
jgi:hypothetical protein